MIHKNFNLSWHDKKATPPMSSWRESRRMSGRLIGSRDSIPRYIIGVQNDENREVVWRHFILIFICILAVTGLILLPNPVLVQGGVTLPNPLGGPNIPPAELYARIIRAFLGFMGIASLLSFTFAGFMFLTSAGNPEKVKKAKDLMLYAVIGIVVSLSSYAILNFIFQVLTTPTTGAG